MQIAEDALAHVSPRASHVRCDARPMRAWRPPASEAHSAKPYELDFFLNFMMHERTDPTQFLRFKKNGRGDSCILTCGPGKAVGAYRRWGTNAGSSKSTTNKSHDRNCWHVSSSWTRNVKKWQGGSATWQRKSFSSNSWCEG